jgi:hypothetical protein
MIARCKYPSPFTCDDPKQVVGLPAGESIELLENHASGDDLFIRTSKNKLYAVVKLFSGPYSLTEMTQSDPFGTIG